MAATILSILAYLIPWLVEVYQAGAPARTQEAKDAEMQKLRVAISTGDVVAVNSITDGLLPAGSMSATGTAADSAGQQHSADSTAAGISDLLGTKIVFR